MIKIEFLDGSIKEYPKNTSLAMIAESISKSLRKKVIAGLVNDEMYDLNTPIINDAKIELIEIDSEAGEEIINHSTAHLLAHAISNLNTNAKFGVGPVIETGFYYDFETENVLTVEDLKTITKEMNRIVAQAIPITRHVVTKREALELFPYDEYKREIIMELEDQTITIYQQGDFKDLCRGVHVENTKLLKNFKLLSIAGAYWRGDSNNKMLQRIYGVAKTTKTKLDDYLNMLEEAKKRDHRKLGKELKLFMLSEYGPGMPFLLPNGMIFREELEKYWHQVHKKYNYQMIKTPVMLNKELWEVSGHWFNYRENMYTSEIDKHEFAIKPMNCPGAMLVYQNEIHSYRDFPLRVGELGLVHRHEASGALHGLFRVRAFTQDDAHIFMREDQIESEIIELIKLFDEVYTTFGLSFKIELSTRPDNAIGSKAIWDQSEKALANAIEKAGYDYKINPKDGAFYGPKLDFKLKDSIGRVWQCGTIQLDMNLPERFDLTYVDQDGNKKRPVMLHRACLGSLERFTGVVIEHYAGLFPTWLAPQQIIVLPVNEVHNEYAAKINQLLLDADIRSSVDYRNEKLGYKIREAAVGKIPYTLVIGDNEVANEEVTYRIHGSQNQTSIKVEDFINKIILEIKNKERV